MAVPKDGTKPVTFHTEQGLLNFSFDDLYKMLAVMLVGEYNSAAYRLQVDVDGNLKVSLGTTEVVLDASDIQIGAVEIKNSSDDTRATVGANGLYVDVRASALPTGAATSANQSSLITELQVTNGGMAMQVDDTTGTIYQGWAEPGTATSAASWRIRRIVSSGSPEDTSITFAGGTRAFSNIWDNRAGLSYS